MFNHFFEALQIKPSISRAIINSSILTGAVFLSGLHQGAQAQSKSIVAVEPLTCDLVSAIAPSSSQVTCLIDRKQDVHDVKISPRQASALKNASQIFTLGQEMTPAMKKWLNNPITVVIGVSAIDIDDHHDDHGGGHLAEKHDDHGGGHSAEKHDDHHDDGHDGHDHHLHGGLDPHVWHDPHNIIKMSKIISDSFKKDFPLFDRKNRKTINKKYQSVASILEDLDQWIQKQVATIPSSQRTIVSKHKAMEYYGDAFGLKTLSLLDFLGHSSSLRPQTIASIGGELRNNNVKALFPEQKPPSKLIRNLSRQTSIPLASKHIYVDGLMPKGNTISVSVYNTCTIVNSLGGSCDKGKGQLLEKKWAALKQ